MDGFVNGILYRWLTLYLLTCGIGFIVAVLGYRYDPMFLWTAMVLLTMTMAITHTIVFVGTLYWLSDLVRPFIVGVIGNVSGWYLVVWLSDRTVDRL